MILQVTIVFVGAAAIAAAAANANQKKKPIDPPREPEEEDDKDESFVDAISSAWSEAEEKIMAEDIEYRKEAFETKLLALYLHKEKESCLLTLRRDVEDKIDEIGKLDVKLKSLEAEIEDLVFKQGKLQLEQSRELELANKTVQQLHKRLTLEADSNSMVLEKMKMIQERVSELQDGELCQSKRDARVDEKLRGFELGILRIKRKNKELEMEKRAISLKLVAARESRAFPILNEREVPPELDEELRIVKQENDELLKQVEALQKSRFSMVEELVYQQWIHACLKFDYSGKPWRPHSETDTNSSSDRSSPSIIKRRTSMERSTSLIRQIKNWGKTQSNFRARRFSTSMIPSRPLSMLSGDSREAEELKNRGIANTLNPRKRRVSFNDHVSIFELTPEMCAEEVRATEPAESVSDTEYPTVTPPDSEIAIDRVSRSSAETDFEIDEQEEEEEVTKLDEDMVNETESEEDFNLRVAIVRLPDQNAVGVGLSHALSLFLCFCFVVAIVVSLARRLLAGK
ncbi:unnamed protein product [Linum tenue]|uniref:Protein CHUP1, chloroplastic n=1 Tax=Linum tenue TaxID=586396 RepID=A0AAV0ITR7_9ROSI|nr:unnamed protein product [Linum tenue]